MKLVIVESPNKIKKITKLLGNGFKVMASLGHFRNLPKKTLGIDIKNNYKPTYEITNRKVVNNLKNAVKTASVVYIATDPDREGEGIAWHLMEVLKLKYPFAKRMTFNEITKSAVQQALIEADNDGKMDDNAVNSYKARQFIDKITGYKASPLLWDNIEGAKSAGRVQSVTTKLVIDREDKIKTHIPEQVFNISGNFMSDNKLIKSSLNKTLKEHKVSLDILNRCKDATFTVKENNSKKVNHSPSPAFKTSVFQQEAGKCYNISPKDAMRIAQKLYENGLITYHRTDVTRLSDQFKQDTKEYILKKYGEEYLSDELKGLITEIKEDKNAQAAHEAIRPTDINKLSIGDFDEKDKLIYKMIWLRAVGSLMAKEKCRRYTILISISNTKDYWFIANHMETLFLGYKILKNVKENDENKVIIDVKEKDELKYDIIESKQGFTKPLSRYTESSLVKELENQGIGRPSTYASNISTIQLRKYVIKKKSDVEKKDCFIDTLKEGIISSKISKVNFGDKKVRLFPTELGFEVTKFLTKNLDYMMDYKFTCNLEKELDDIVSGNKNWISVVDTLTKTLEKLINKIPILSKNNKKMSSNIVGKFEDKDITYFIGKYGPCLKYNDKFYSLPKDLIDIKHVSLQLAIDTINNKDKPKYLVSYDCKIGNKKGKIQGLNGKFGNYLRFIPDDGGKMTSYFLPFDMKNDDDKVKNLTLEQCLEQVEYVIKYKKSKK